LPSGGESTANLTDVIDGPDRQEVFEQAAAEARAIAEPESEQPASLESAPTPPPAPDEARRTASLFVAEMLPFGALAPFRGDHWKITQEQVEQLAPLWAEVLDKYYPGWWERTGPEIRLGIAVGFICLAKYQVEKVLMKQLEKQVEEAHATEPAKPAVPPSAGTEYAPSGRVCLEHKRENCPDCPETSGPTAAPPKKPN
jgi:hypothetical protein